MSRDSRRRHAAGIAPALRRFVIGRYGPSAFRLLSVWNAITVCPALFDGRKCAHTRVLAFEWPYLRCRDASSPRNYYEHEPQRYRSSYH